MSWFAEVHNQRDPDAISPNIKADGYLIVAMTEYMPGAGRICKNSDVEYFGKVLMMASHKLLKFTPIFVMFFLLKSIQQHDTSCGLLCIEFVMLFS